MMKDFNEVMLSGRIGTDIKLYQSQGNYDEDGGENEGGSTRTFFRLASNRSVRDASSESGFRPVTTWVNVLAWGDLAARLQKVASKGDHVWLKGRLQNNIRKTESGFSYEVTELVALDFGLIEKKAAPTAANGSSGSGSSNGSKGQTGANKGKRHSEPEYGEKDFDEAESDDTLVSIGL